MRKFSTLYLFVPCFLLKRLFSVSEVCSHIVITWRRKQTLAKVCGEEMRNDGKMIQKGTRNKRLATFQDVDRITIDALTNLAYPGWKYSVFNLYVLFFKSNVFKVSVGEGVKAVSGILLLTIPIFIKLTLCTTLQSFSNAPCSSVTSKTFLSSTNRN